MCILVRPLQRIGHNKLTFDQSKADLNKHQKNMCIIQPQKASTITPYPLIILIIVLKTKIMHYYGQKNLFLCQKLDEILI